MFFFPGRMNVDKNVICYSIYFYKKIVKTPTHYSRITLFWALDGLHYKSLVHGGLVGLRLIGPLDILGESYLDQ